MEKTTPWPGTIHMMEVAHFILALGIQKKPTGKNCSCSTFLLELSGLWAVMI